MPGISLGSGDRAVNKYNKKHDLRELTFQSERKKRKENDFIIWHGMIYAMEIKQRMIESGIAVLDRMIKECIPH